MSTPSQPRRSGRIRQPTPKNPLNTASPPIRNAPSEFESQRRSERAKKGWETRRTRDQTTSTTIEPQDSPFLTGSPTVSSTRIYALLAFLCHWVQGKRFKKAEETWRTHKSSVKSVVDCE